MEAWFHSFFSTALDGVASYLNRPLYSWGKKSGTQRTRGYLDPVAGQEAVDTFQGSEHPFLGSSVRSFHCVNVVPYSTRQMKPSVCTCTMFQYRQSTPIFMWPEGQTC